MSFIKIQTNEYKSREIRKNNYIAPSQSRKDGYGTLALASALFPSCLNLAYQNFLVLHLAILFILLRNP